MTKSKTSISKTFKSAFPKTIPVLTGYVFLGMTYGMLMKENGFGFLFPVLMAFTIYGGSLEFVAVQMLMSTFAPLQTFLMTLIIQARHLFYGLTMLDKYRGTGVKKFSLIYGLSDETFAVNSSAVIPKDVDKGIFYLLVTVLDRIYWISGAALGWLFGALIKFDLTGLDFVMTAMFVVIFLDQWMKEKRHDTALIGIGASAASLIVFGPDSFMIPAMCLIVILLTLMRGRLRPLYMETIENSIYSDARDAVSGSKGIKDGSCNATIVRTDAGKETKSEDHDD